MESHDDTNPWEENRPGSWVGGEVEMARVSAAFHVSYNLRSAETRVRLYLFPYEEEARCQNILEVGFDSLAGAELNMSSHGDWIIKK